MSSTYSFCSEKKIFFFVRSFICCAPPCHHSTTLNSVIGVEHLSWPWHPSSHFQTQYSHAQTHIVCLWELFLDSRPPHTITISTPYPLRLVLPLPSWCFSGEESWRCLCAMRTIQNAENSFEISIPLEMYGKRRADSST